MTLTVLQTEQARPFYCGTQAADWKASNCWRCTKAYDEQAGEWRCDLERAIDDAQFGDGTISPDIARRIGYDNSSFAHVWACTEVVWTEAWKAEARRRRTTRYRLARQWHLFKRWARHQTAGRLERWRERYRFRIAERHADDRTTCWAEWVMWSTAPFGDQERPVPNGVGFKRCEAEGSVPGGSCYCGRFQMPKTDDAFPTPASAEVQP